MYDTLGRGFVDYRDSCSQRFFRGVGILAVDSFTDSLDKSLQGRADMFVPGVFNLVLLDTLESRLMMSQTAPPEYMNQYQTISERNFISSVTPECQLKNS